MWGVTVMHDTVAKNIWSFNTHARVGRDVRADVAAVCSRGFNPHARVGRDFLDKIPEELRAVSIHTPVWGVTFANSHLFNISNVSIQTPVWGVTKQ